ncbi:MAG: 4Fe-4S dicluster domain-containing protein [Candidatus Marinimicrobia bacterium]|nr:4Fe-4S dicluster domain-containing protein [Candidatus Neomarinimicrobiota bacterium]
MNREQNKIIRESIITFLFFLALGIIFWKTKGHPFFLFNFGYIGLAAGLGELLFGLLPRKNKTIGRKVSQLLIGFYLLGVLGFLGRENMQLEGFFFYLLAGIFSGPVIHYLIAKTAGTFLFGRGWCGWACWTAMVIDFLPWSKPANGRIKKAGILRYIHLFFSFILVMTIWFVFKKRNFHQQTQVELQWLVIGNLFYFIIAIFLAVLLRDNRAFCKYICPIPPLMKIGARFSIWKIMIEKEKCTECGLCEAHCPMNIRLLDYMKKNQRVQSTECIACQQCVNICPAAAVLYSKGLDIGTREYLTFQGPSNN